MLQLQLILKRSKQAHHKVELMTSKTQRILTSAICLEHWSINEVKENFEYVVTKSGTVQVTVWIDFGNLNYLWNLKEPLLNFLHKYKIWIEDHHGEMNAVETITTGWYSENEHPDVCHKSQLQEQLNKDIHQEFEENKEEIMETIDKYPPLREWDGNNLPNVTVTTVKPRWRSGPKTCYHTRATGVTAPKKYASLLGHLVSRVDLKNNDGQPTFVQSELQWSGEQ